MKTMNKLIAIVGLLCPMGISAQVDETQIIPFQAGTPATAAHMNQTIQALIATINSNNAELKLLRQELALVPTTVNLPQPTLEQDIAGSVYRLGYFSVEAGNNNFIRDGDYKVQNIRHTINNGEIILTLNTDGTLTLQLDEHEREMNLYILRYEPSGATVLSDGTVSSERGDFPTVETINGTWSVAGNILTLNLGGDAETLFVSPDGNSVFNNENDTYVDNGLNMFGANLFMGVRISKPQPNIEVHFPVPGEITSTIVVVNNDDPVKFDDTNPRTITIKNTGNGNLVLGSSALIQDVGGDFTFPTQDAPVSIAPNTEFTLQVTNPHDQGNNRQDGKVYLMTNDPDTPTFILNIYSTDNP